MPKLYVHPLPFSFTLPGAARSEPIPHFSDARDRKKKKKPRDYSFSRFDCPFMKIRGPKLYGKFEPGRINSLVASKFNGEFRTGGILCTRNFICGAAKFRAEISMYGEVLWRIRDDSPKFELSSEIKQTDNDSTKRCNTTSYLHM